MRFLVTCVPGLGHFNPLVPLAQALKHAGHTLAVATAPSFADVITGAGLEFFPAGPDWDERRLIETLPELRAVQKMYRGEWMMNNLFLDRSPRRMIEDIGEVIRGFRPDAIIAGSFEYGGPLAAEKAGLPYANANYTVRWNRWILKHAIGPAIGRLRRQIGLPPDPDVKAFGRYLDLCFSPPSWTFEGALLRPELTRLVIAKLTSPDLPFRQRLSGLRALALQRIFAMSLGRDPEQAAIGPKLHFVGDGLSSDHPSAPRWLEEMPRQQTVFVSLGTVLGAEYPHLFDQILAALRDQEVNLIMTLGGTADPSRFGVQPSNVRVVRFMSQEELRQLLPHVDLSINHAGYGSVMEALLRGIPLVLLPLVSDAPMNMQMCLSSGVAPDLPQKVWGLSPKGLPIIRPEKLTPDIIRDAAMQALHDPKYRMAAMRIRSELDERESLDDAVRLLEQIGAKR